MISDEKEQQIAESLQKQAKLLELIAIELDAIHTELEKR